jgi:hypothetical protein
MCRYWTWTGTIEQEKHEEEKEKESEKKEEKHDKGKEDHDQMKESPVKNCYLKVEKGESVEMSGSLSGSTPRACADHADILSNMKADMEKEEERADTTGVYSEDGELATTETTHTDKAESHDKEEGHSEDAKQMSEDKQNEEAASDVKHEHNETTAHSEDATETHDLHDETTVKHFKDKEEATTMVAEVNKESEITAVHDETTEGASNSELKDAEHTTALGDKQVEDMTDDHKANDSHTPAGDASDHHVAGKESGDHSMDETTTAHQLDVKEDEQHADSEHTAEHNLDGHEEKATGSHAETENSVTDKATTMQDLQEKKENDAADTDNKKKASEVDTKSGGRKPKRMEAKFPTAAANKSQESVRPDGSEVAVELTADTDSATEVTVVKEENAAAAGTGTEATTVVKEGTHKEVDDMTTEAGSVQDKEKEEATTATSGENMEHDITEVPKIHGIEEAVEETTVDGKAESDLVTGSSELADEAAKEVSKEVGKETGKEVTKSSPKDMPKEAVKEAAKETAMADKPMTNAKEETAQNNDRPNVMIRSKEEMAESSKDEEEIKAKAPVAQKTKPMGPSGKKT